MILKSKKQSSINHVAIIMDGNGRWAKERKRPRFWGHIRGAKIVSDIVESAVESELCALTLYTFSTENWSRPLTEVKIIFKLLRKFLIKEKIKILKNNIKFKVIGDYSGVPEDIRLLIKQLENETTSNDGLILSIAFGYGGREEIVRAANRFIEKNPDELLTEESFNDNMYNTQSGDVDLLIRTGGDHRISNFLLWQSAYAELYFIDTKWPDFNKLTFLEIINQTSCRERRFGHVAAMDSLKTSLVRAKENIEKLKGNSERP